MNTTGQSMDTMYSSGAWYRVDPKHPDGVSKSHRRHVATDNGLNSASTHALDIGCFNVSSDLLSSCLVIARSSSPVEGTTAVVPSSRASATTARDSSSVEQTAVTETVKVKSGSGPVDVPASQKDRGHGPQVGWTAIWEVDEFIWPDEITRLYDAHADYFHYAGEKLRDASGEGLKVLAIAATRQHEGCTTLAVCLARGAASTGAKVALLDGNGLKPELGFKLGLDFSHGWQDSRDGRTPLAESAVHSIADRLTLFPLSGPHHVSTLNDVRVSRLLREMSQLFDLVIVDAGAAPRGGAPLFEAGDGCPVNAAMIVRDTRRSTETETLATATRLKSLGIQAIGIAENFAPRQAINAAAA